MSTTTYTQGHSKDVLASHEQRNATNSAAFLLPHLKPNHRILDVGCGPGTITSDFATRVPQGSVVGVDLSPTAISQARKLAPPDKFPNLSFDAGDLVEGLDKTKFPDNSFDVVYTHQVLVHVPERVKMMKEIYRLLKPGGFAALRETDGFSWYPELEGLAIHDKALADMVKARGALGAKIGRRLHVDAAEAGFDRKKMIFGAGATVYAGDELRNWWANVMIGRLQDGTDVKKAMMAGGLTEDECQIILRDLKIWKDDPDGWFTIWNGELLAWK